MEMKILKLLICGFIMSLMVSGLAFAGSPVKEEGTLMSIEEDGVVVIEKRGYRVDTFVEVLDDEGKKISLEDLSPPARVYYVYTYTESGPEISTIKLIRE